MDFNVPMTRIDDPDPGPTVPQHPSKPTDAIMKFFEYDHLPAKLQRISEPIAELALEMVDILPPSAELTTGIRKLLEAKDCLVRAAL